MFSIVAFTHKTLGIGKAGQIPWNIPEDMARFRKFTTGGLVVMGRKTFESMGSKPLSNRFNVVLTSSQEPMPQYHNLQYVKSLDNISVMLEDEDVPCYLIGGSKLYEWGMGKVQKIYATVIEKEFDCDTFFPKHMFDQYEIEDYSERMFSEEEQCYFRYITYSLRKRPCLESPYINLMKETLFKGHERPDRTGVGTISLFGQQMRFDLSGGHVPLLTTKQMAWRTVLKELLWFMKGDCNSKNLESQGVKIWQGNTTREFLDKRGLTKYDEGDMGPLYSHSFRHFGAEYKGCNHDYTNEGYDQLQNLVKGLIEDPYSRRHVITTFNPAVVDQCVLMPCHGIAIQFYVENDQRLSCHVYCRSSDVFLGLPFNIASYAFFLHIIAKKTKMYPRHLIISTGDTHIYQNHVDQVKQQFNNDILPSPIFNVLNDKPFDEYTLDDFELVGYLHHKSISAPMAV